MQQLSPNSLRRLVIPTSWLTLRVLIPTPLLLPSPSTFSPFLSCCHAVENYDVSFIEEWKARSSVVSSGAVSSIFSCERKNTTAIHMSVPHRSLHTLLPYVIYHVFISWRRISTVRDNLQRNEWIRISDKLLFCSSMYNPTHLLERVYPVGWVRRMRIQVSDSFKAQPCRGNFGCED